MPSKNKAKDKRAAAGARLKQIRKQLGMRQQDLADLFGQTQGYIANIEKGTALPGAEVLAGMERLGYSGNWLLSGEGTMKPKATTTEGAAAPSILAALVHPPDNVPEGRVVRPFPGLIGKSHSIFRLVRNVVEAATLGRGVLFTGEPGSGAELAANGLNEYSLRAGKPFIALDCANDRPDAGRIEAAVSDAQAGTLFLHEVAGLSAGAQTRLAEILPNHDLRLVGATSLPSPRDSGRISQKLLERMPVTVACPPLRERRADVPLAADHLLRTYRRTLNRPGQEFELESWQRLLAEDFTAGNFRQLDWVIEACVTQERGRMISDATMARLIAASAKENYARLFGGTFHATERTLIEDALANYDGRPAQAGISLGIGEFFLFFLTILLNISVKRDAD